MGRNDPMRNHLGRIRIVAKLQRHCVQRHPATFPYTIFLHRWPFCIRHHFTFVFVLSVAVIVRFAIESFCSVFSCLFRDWDRWFYKDHRSFFSFYMFYEYNRLFCRNVFFTLSAAHIPYYRLRPYNQIQGGFHSKGVYRVSIVKRPLLSTLPYLFAFYDFIK